MSGKERSSQKFWCYLVSLVAFLLTILPAYICRTGLCILLIFAPLAAAHWLRSGSGLRAAGRSPLWLLLSLGWAMGLLASRQGVVSAFCLCMSLLSWSICLCHNVCDGPRRKLWEICLIALAAEFDDPMAFFVSESTDSDKRKSRAAKWVYGIYILGGVLVLLLLLLTQADSRIDGILRIFIGYVLEKAPLLISCLVLALFPAAILYSFLSKLEAISKTYTEATQPDGSAPLPFLSWSKLCNLLTAANWFFLLIEIYYGVWRKESLPLREDGLYDVLVVALMTLFGLIALCCQIRYAQGRGKKQSVALGVSIVGLIIFTSWRLGGYIARFGLWEGRVILGAALMIFVLLLVCMLGFSGRGYHVFFRNAGIAIAVFLTMWSVIPSGVALTQVNAAIFLYKYHTQQLEGQGQSNASTGAAVELTDHDLRLDLMESYGIDGIPALIRLAAIEDVTAEGRTLGGHVRETILNCLCDDLGLTRTGNDPDDIQAVLDASNNVPRYRLPTSYSWALARLEEVKGLF